MDHFENAPLGLQSDGEGGMLLGGKPFIGIGVNCYDLFVSVFFRNWDEKPSLKAMDTLKEYGCKVIRFSTLPFYVQEFVYFEQTEAYWNTLDKIVKKAEELEIGLLPSLFWTYSVNDYCDESYQSAYFDENSRTVAFTRKYTSDFVRRYRNSPAIFGWEFSNERVLGSDFPDVTHLPPLWEKSKRIARDSQDRITLDGLERMYRIFAEIVEGEDPHGRIISTGDTNPRETSYHQYAEGVFKKDSPEEHERVLDKINPKGITALSQHQYSLGELLDPSGKTYPLLNYFDDWESFFKYLTNMAKKRNMCAYAGEIGYSFIYPERYGEIKLEYAVRPFEEAVNAQIKTKIPLILFWNYDPSTECLDKKNVFDRGTGIEYSFGDKTERGRRILEVMRDGNIRLEAMGK